MNKSDFLYLFIFLWHTFGAYLTYSAGQNYVFAYPGNDCYNSVGKSPREVVINFPGAFAKPPKVITFFQGFDMGNSVVEFTQNILVVDETSCKIKITCLSTSGVWDYPVKWLAFDDSQITVIDSGIVNVTNQQSQTFSFTHNNIYATKGFISLAAFGFKGAQDYTLKITSITSSQVNVSFTANNANLLSIGFLVVLGPNGAFTVSDQLETGPILSGQSIGQVLDNVENNILFVPLVGYKWTNTAKGLRLGITWTKTTTTTQYQFTQWGGSSYQTIRYQQVWFSTINQKAKYPFICTWMRITKKQQLTFNPLKLYIVESQKTYLLNDYQQWALNPGLYTVNFVASVLCPVTFRIEGFVYKCLDCVKNTYDLSTDCYSGIDFVEYRIRLFSSEQVAQQLEIQVTQSKIMVSQLAENPNSVILQLEIKQK